MKKIGKLLLATALSLSITHVQAQHELPKLNYSYNSLQPYIDSATMNIHYNKHHAGYVNNLNKAIKGTSIENEKIENILKNISKYDVAVRNNAGGHYNHTLFWTILSPISTKISPRLEEAIVKTFGSMDDFKTKMESAASSRFGSGWAWLSVDENKKLFISSTPNQDNPLMDVADQKGTPILGIDVWEHAYYLNYQNKRGDYLKNIWNVLNWEEVSRRYDALVPKNIFDSWPEIKAFHKVMSETFHPAEEGKFEPIKMRSDELYQSSLILVKSKVPEEFNTKDIHKSLNNLVKSTQNVNKLVKKKSSDKVINEALIKAHDAFHEIVGLCRDIDKH